MLFNLTFTNTYMHLGVHLVINMVYSPIQILVFLESWNQAYFVSVVKSFIVSIKTCKAIEKDSALYVQCTMLCINRLKCIILFAIVKQCYALKWHYLFDFNYNFTLSIIVFLSRFNVQFHWYTSSHLSLLLVRYWYILIYWFSRFFTQKLCNKKKLA